VNFPVRTAPRAAPEVAPTASDDSTWLPMAFAALAGVALLSALTFALLRVRTIRRTRAVHA
jgi:hypothetical protein